MCSKTFLNSRDFIQHKGHSHPVKVTATYPSVAEGVISFEQHNEKFQSLWALIRHQETPHAPSCIRTAFSRVYNCYFCGFNCPHHHSLIRHNREKHGLIGFGQPIQQRPPVGE